MKIQKKISIIGLIILIVAIGRSYMKISAYSKYISLSAEELLSGYDEDYASFSTMAYGNDSVSAGYALLGGSDYIGCFSVKEDTTVSISAQKRMGDLKVLIVDISSEESIYYALADENTVSLDVKAGEYGICLIGNHFSGKCTVSYVDGEFKADNT